MKILVKSDLTMKMKKEIEFWVHKEYHSVPIVKTLTFQLVLNILNAYSISKLCLLNWNSLMWAECSMITIAIFLY